MKTADFQFYLHCCSCTLIKQSRLFWVWKSDIGGITRIQRKEEYLERQAVFLHCMDLGIDMPEKFARFQQDAERALPDRKYKP